MIVAVYGDVHLTKNMRHLQSIWDVTSTKSIHHMYNKFDDLSVELVVCLGDFFDTPRLEAKHLSLVLPILEDINNRSYPTYILLGNHEADSEESNILEYLRVYENIHPITSACEIECMMFLPYYERPEEFSTSMQNKIVFTHHDIYGSDLASGKTKAFFGIDPSVFRDAKLVMNGHVHLKSKVTDNIVNTGSLLVSQQGELRVGDVPEYYVLDTCTANYESYKNEHSMIYLTIDKSEVDKIVGAGYDTSHCVLKVEYDDEIPKDFINTAHISFRKRVSSIESEEEVISRSNFDMRNYLVDYIKNDSGISEDKKDNYIKTGLELISE